MMLIKVPKSVVVPCQQCQLLQRRTRLNPGLLNTVYPVVGDEKRLVFPTTGRCRNMYKRGYTQDSTQRGVCGECNGKLRPAIVSNIYLLYSSPAGFSTSCETCKDVRVINTINPLVIAQSHGFHNSACHSRLRFTAALDLYRTFRNSPPVNTDSQRCRKPRAVCSNNCGVTLIFRRFTTLVIPCGCATTSMTGW